MYKKIIYLIFLFPVLLWCLFVILAPYLMSIHQDFAAKLIYFLFSLGCHQLPERSFFVFNYPLAVCARCTAIYFGFLITPLIYPLFKRVDNKETPSKWLLVLSLIPMGLDGLIQLMTNYESTNIIRAITGGIFGLILPLYIIPVYNMIVYDAVDLLKNRL